MDRGESCERASVKIVLRVSGAREWMVAGILGEGLVLGDGGF
jgi:hypothetical protein